MEDATPSSMSSNKPYIVKAFYEWISDNDLTPYIMVDVNVYGVLVPMNYVADGQIVLNIAGSAVGTIALGDKTINFSARFGGKLEHITVPYGAIGAIYAKENGAGTSLPIEHPAEDEDDLVDEVPEKPKSTLSSVASTGSEKDKSNKPKGKSKASLKIIK
ncbi:ClpXP protease specificity-enhancing factor [Colwellia psychrerythraea]|uniref:Stringent starvation protein B n=1 Tax=Colwellia psychrerythraea TaxID=28229 RepID=A0A099KLW9_COLPS|nr:ClpXP protease specificity-enhancing factor [Colwellia psychrerythraea]KGJ91230.1 Stringent starvation protein B [Colwellia psychrerythraea]